jgi:hypothetical protein
MPLQATSGAASYDGFGGGVAAVPNYIEEVFSTYLYTGNGATQTITNGIDLAGKGGLVWSKDRTSAYNNALSDTVRGITFRLISDLTLQQVTGGLDSVNSTGYVTGSSIYSNNAGDNYVSWTFRKQPKFFDVVTYTGTGSNTTIAHSLGSVPACIMVKRTDTTGAWQVYHRSLANTEYLVLNTTAAKATGATRWNSTTPTSTVFSVGTDATVNASGGTYVAYLFAHDAGGFGLTGTDNVISCGSFTTDGSGLATVSLGYEPQWVLIKRTNGADNWYLNDNMRGMAVSGNQPNLSPNLSDAESAGGYNTYPNATGFTASVGIASAAHIYIAIRRGPMKVPTTGTSVFAPVTRAGTGAAVTVTGAAFPPDFLFNIDRFGTGPAARYNYDRLRGAGQTDLRTNSTAAEGSAGAIGVSSFNMNGFSIPTSGVSFLNDGAASYINYFFGRAPSFFDEVCYTGTGVARTVTHNLTVVPELMIVKNRSAADTWAVYAAPLGATKYLDLTSTAGEATSSSLWSDTTPTSSVFTVDVGFRVNRSGSNLVAYLFATCAGVSKVGSYTGTGATQTINCGFAAGARFVLIKRTDSTGDWYVWDTARGIVSGNDSYLLLNSTAAEVTSTDYIDTYSAGFEISSTAPAAINANGGSFIFFAVA